MSAEVGESSSSQVDRKRRMSLKGPPLRVAMKQTAAAAPPAPAPAPRPVAQTSSVIDRRQSLSARQAAKTVVAKATSSTHHTQVTTSAPADPFQMVNARLDAIERQMAEFQSVIGRLAMVEELLKPMKPALAQMQVDCSDLSEIVKTLQIQSEEHERQLNARVDLEEVPVGAEYEAEAIGILDASLESGEIDIDQYATSLRIALNPEARKDNTSYLQEPLYDIDSPTQKTQIRPIPQMHPVPQQQLFRGAIIPNTSTPPPHHLAKKMPATTARPTTTPSPPQFAPQSVASKPFIRHVDSKSPSYGAKVTSVAPEAVNPVRREVVLPAIIARPTSTSTSTAASQPPRQVLQQQTVETVQLPTAVSRSKSVPVLQAAVENEAPVMNVTSTLSSIQSRKKPAETPSLELGHSDNMFQMMEPIAKEEREHVKFWLGIDMPELNRAVSIMNEFATTQRFEMTSFKEFFITVDDVAEQCKLDPKRAKAVVLLLCNFKRLKLVVRGDTNSYTLLSGTTLVK